MDDPLPADRQLTSPAIEALCLVVANFLVAVHAVFLAFVLVGVLIVLRWPALWRVHAACAAWGLFIELTRFTCPLTTLEKWLRVQGGAPSYNGGFFEQYIVSMVLPAGLPRALQTSIVLALTTMTLAGYIRLFRLRAVEVERFESAG